MKLRTAGLIAAVALAALTATIARRGRPSEPDARAAPSSSASSVPDGARLGAPPSRREPPRWAPALQALASARARYEAEERTGGGEGNELAEVLERHRGMTERFEKEARDSEWAPAREKELLDSVDRDFTAGHQDAWVSSVRCHTSTCLLEIASPSAAGLERAKLMMSYAPRAPAIQFRGESTTPGNEHVAGFVLEFDGSNQDPEAYADWQRTTRQSALEDLSRLRAGRRIPDEVPPAPPL